MDSDDGPLIDLEDLEDLDDGFIDEDDQVASNDQWAYDQADRMTARLPQREGVDRRTEGEVFDPPTLMTLHRLLSHGVLRSLDHPISTGKEANVFRGTTPGGGHVAVKIYRINTATFKHVLKYIQGDERFEGVGGDKRGLVYAWAQKEFRNLHRLRDAGVSVPEPIKVLNNVLVTEFLGRDGDAWPKLKDLGRLDRDEAIRFWAMLRDDYVASYNKAGLVHADLSEYNVLVEDYDAEWTAPAGPSGTVLAGADEPSPEPARQARPRIIDVGQAVLKTHPMAWEFLERDARNITSFFRRHRVRCDPSDLTRLLEHAP